MAVTYLAGPMSGLPEFNRPAFFAEANRQASAGKGVLNPATLPDGLSQAQYMSICMPMVAAADEIVLLPGWWHSAGAKAERAYAEKLGKVITELAF